MTTLLELVGRDVALRKTSNTAGGEYHGPCPWCGGRDRFIVWPDRAKPGYLCRGCGKQGDAIAYLREHDGLTFAEARAALGQPLGPPSAPRRVPPAAPAHTDPPGAVWQERARAFADFAAQQLWETPAGAPALAYLRECRGLGDATIRSWRLGYNAQRHERPAARWGLTGKPVWLPRGLVVPCAIGADLWYLTVRQPMLEDGQPDELARYVGDGQSTSGKYIRPRGHASALFGADTLAGQSVAVVTEGELDAVLLHQETGGRVGVCTMGGVKTPMTARWLLRLAGVRLVLAAHDADEEGDLAAAALERMSPRVKRARPIGAKDLDEMRRAGRSLADWLDFYLRLHATAAADDPPAEPATAPEPTGPCPCCGTRDWWYRLEGWFCGACDRLEVAEVGTEPDRLVPGERVG